MIHKFDIDKIDKSTVILYDPEAYFFTNQNRKYIIDFTSVT